MVVFEKISQNSALYKFYFVSLYSKSIMRNNRNT